MKAHMRLSVNNTNLPVSHTISKLLRTVGHIFACVRECLSLLHSFGVGVVKFGNRKLETLLYRMVQKYFNIMNHLDLSV